MKYVNQISLVLALAGVLVVVYTFSSTYLDGSEFEPIPVEPVEIEAPSPRPTSQQGFTTNLPAATFSQLLAERRRGSDDSSTNMESEPDTNPDQDLDTPLQTQIPAVQNPTADERRKIPNRFLNPPQNQPRRVGSAMSVGSGGSADNSPEVNRQGSSLVGGGSRRSPSRETTSPYGTAVQKRAPGSNPTPPPPRGSMQQNPPQ